jgi:hypothetical protein
MNSGGIAATMRTLSAALSARPSETISCRTYAPG